MRKIMVFSAALMIILLAFTGCQQETTEPPPPDSGLFLEINEPADESVVAQSPLTVTGLTSPKATVSINGEIIAVNALGEFAATVALEVGPNVIEVLASDRYDNEVYRIITVIYTPS